MTPLLRNAWAWRIRLFKGLSGAVRLQSRSQLAAAVSNAGGLGSFGANDLAPGDVFNTVVEIRKLTGKPFSVNLWVSTFDRGGDTLDEADL